MLQSTEKQLKQIQRMVECAYLNGFHFDETKGPKACAIELVHQLRESIVQEIVLARGRGVVASWATALIEHDEARGFVR